jgi:hypothetical protein
VGDGLLGSGYVGSSGGVPASADDVGPMVPAPGVTSPRAPSKARRAAARPVVSPPLVSTSSAWPASCAAIARGSDSGIPAASCVAHARAS